MGLFHDTLGGLDDHPDLNVPEGFGQAITGAYDADLAGAGSSAEAKVADLMGQIETLKAELSAQKLINYDLVMETKADTTDEEDADENRDGPAASDAELPDTIEGLFEPVEPDNDQEV